MNRTELSVMCGGAAVALLAGVACAGMSLPTRAVLERDGASGPAVAFAPGAIDRDPPGAVTTAAYPVPAPPEPAVTHVAYAPARPLGGRTSKATVQEQDAGDAEAADPPTDRPPEAFAYPPSSAYRDSPDFRAPADARPAPPEPSPTDDPAS